MMSAFTLLPGALVVVGTVAVSPTAGTGRSFLPAPKAQPVISGSPQAWALATTAHLTYNNGWRINTLATKYPSRSAIAETRQMLHDWWRIENRQDLLQKLDWLTREGLRDDFQMRGQRLVSMTDAEFRAFSARHPVDTRRVMKLCREHYRKRGPNSLAAWDYCRFIMLCRCGYQVGYLSEVEAWERIMPMARAIQAAFPSWAEMGEDYLVGREFWSIAETRTSGQYYRELEVWLVQKPESPWNQLAWGMDLGDGAVSTR
jgi:hypothetical protein